MRRLAVAVCSFGFIGFFPIAPGTVGSLAGAAVYALLHRGGLTSLTLPIAAGLFLVGWVLGAEAERALGGVDPGPVVIDEVMGMLLTVVFVPVGWLGLGLGFFVFRLLDVVKPFPASALERLPGGLGMMADDAMAAIYGNLILHAAFWLSPRLVS